jgi:transcriptional regulator with XRE-family HTH domain
MTTNPLEIRSVFAKNVKEQRKKLGFTLERLAELTGLAVQTINDIEGGRRWVSDKTITKLSAALQIENYQLFIADFFSQNRKKDNLTQQLLDMKKKIQKNVDFQIEIQFSDFFKSGFDSSFDETRNFSHQQEDRESTSTQKSKGRAGRSM